jgi:hypothetical protein
VSGLDRQAVTVSAYDANTKKAIAAAATNVQMNVTCNATGAIVSVAGTGGMAGTNGNTKKIHYYATARVDDDNSQRLKAAYYSDGLAGATHTSATAATAGTDATYPGITASQTLTGKNLTLALNTLAGTDLLPADTYTDIVTVTVTP